MPSLFDFAAHGSLDSKMHISHGSLPPYIDPTQPPTKKSPWRQIEELALIQTVTMLMPDELYTLVWDKIDIESKKVKYAKVIMKLQDVLDGEFFTEYIKKGNIIMLSEGRAGVDNIFSLRNGVLRLDLDRETYERTGLEGRPIRSGARKHIKSRYVVEVDLRQPSMLHGKKGFERIVWAAKNVFNQSIVWLFADVNKSKTSPALSLPLDKHHPTCLDLLPSMQSHEGIVVPDALYALSRDKTGPPALEDEELYYDLIEWIDLICLGSRGVLNEFSVEAHGAHPGKTATPGTLRVLTVQGLVSPEWLRDMLISVIALSRVSKLATWLSITVTLRGTEAVDHTDGYTMILLPSQIPPTEHENIAEASAQLPLFETDRLWQQSGLQHVLVIEMTDTIKGT